MRLGVLDAGVAYETWGAFTRLPAYGNVLFSGAWDYVEAEGHANDDHQHGTHVTSTAVGIAGGRAEVVPIRVLNRNADGTELNVAKGLLRALDSGAAVVNLSLTFGRYYVPGEVMVQALQQAADRGVLLIAASGNEGSPVVAYPAALPGVLSVGALDQDLAPAAYGDYGAGLTVTAPGGGVEVPVSGLQAAAFGLNNPANLAVVRSSGTSMAAAVVSGVALLARAQHPGLTGPQLHQLLAATAQDRGPVGYDDRYGAGLVDAAAVVRTARDLRLNPGGPSAALVRELETSVSVTSFLQGTGFGATAAVNAVALVDLADAADRPISGVVVRGTWMGTREGPATCTTDATGRCLMVSAPHTVGFTTPPLLFGLRVDRAILPDGRQSRPQPAHWVDAERATALQQSFVNGAPMALVRFRAANPGNGSRLAGRRLLDGYQALSLAHARVGSEVALVFNEAFRSGLGKTTTQIVDNGLELMSRARFAAGPTPWNAFSAGLGASTWPGFSLFNVPYASDR